MSMVLLRFMACERHALLASPFVVFAPLMFPILFLMGAAPFARGEADAAFFLSEVYHSLSRLTRSQMQVLIESDLSDISHVVLVKESFAQSELFIQALLNLKDSAEGKQVLAELGMEAGFEAMTQEDGEFMIDLMDTLLD